MRRKRIIPATPPPSRQIPFAPAAGFVQEIAPPRDKCRGCGEARPPGPQPCPACGHVRKGAAGGPYPEGGLARYQWVWDQDISNPTAKFVLLALVHHHHPGGAIYPSQARLAEMIGGSESTVLRALKWLEAHGWIERARRHHRGHRTSDRFTIMQAEDRLPGNMPVRLTGILPV